MLDFFHKKPKGGKNGQKKNEMSNPVDQGS